MSVPQDRGDRLDIEGTLSGETLFVSGATGFLGKVLVEKLLWSVPDLRTLLLLIRPSRGLGAVERLHREVLEAPLFARLRTRYGEDWPRWVAGKIEVVEGDLSHDRFGLEDDAYDALAARVDRVVANAATVTFDERLDRALALNARGALRTLALARDAGDAPLVHVSTCFVSGTRKGLVEEQVVAPEALDAARAIDSLDAAAEAVRAAGETGDAAWVAAGAEQAERLGFNDVYTLTKALAERWLDEQRGTVPVAILRPAIVESARREPIPGWIEAVRVADPILVAYGRGSTDTLPGAADVPLELIPVDFVANALLAALVALPKGGASQPAAPIPVYQLGSRRNPITLGELMTQARTGFAACPLRDDEGTPISVPPARFVPPVAYRRDLVRQRGRVRALARWVPRRRTSRARLALGSTERTLDHLIHLLGVYRPYLERGAAYDDTRSLALFGRLSAEERAVFPFDVAAIDWSRYVPEVHVPGLVRFALRADTGAPVPVPEEERASRTAILERAAAHAASAGTIFELFAASAEAYPEVTAFQTFRDGHWLRYRYRQAEVASANVAHALATRHGVGPGDRVVLWSSGRPEWAITTLAVHRLGATVVPLDPQWPAAEVARAVALVGAKLACVMPPLVEALDGTSLGCPVVPLAEPFVPSPDVALVPGAYAIGVRGAENDLASIIFTSGTTVAPKAVPLTHANYLTNVRALVPLMELTRERLLSVLPMHHVFEQMVGWLVPMSGGSTFSYVAEIKPTEISWMMATTRPTVLVAVPRLLELLHGGIERNVASGGPFLKLVFKVLFALSRRRDGANGHRLFAKVHRRFGGSLRRIASGGSALEPSLGRSFQLMGFKVAEGYGMTETSPVLTVNPWNAIRFGSVGRPLPGVEIDLREPDEAADGLAPGAGEVWVRGGNVMAGYLDNPEATAAVMDQDGWLNTGDIGFFDDDGYLHLAGRTKDVIVTGAGKNVYPEEVEARYRNLPGVAELVVLGLPGDSGGERVVGLVVPDPGTGEDALRRAVEERSRTVPSYQQIAGVEVWRGALPKTTTMKVKRAVLRDAVLAGERGTGDPSPAAPAPVEESRSPAEEAVVEAVARLTRSRADVVRASDRLTDLGVDSLTRVALIGELEARFGLRLDDDEAAALHTVRDLFNVTE